MLKNILLAGFFLTTVYFGLQSFEANRKITCLESELCAARTIRSAESAIQQDVLVEKAPVSAPTEQKFINITGNAVSESTAQASMGPESSKSKSDQPSVPAEVVDWRLNSVAKLVDLNQDQRSQLKELFSSTSADPLAQKNGLKEILGEDNYDSYQEARVRARVKIESENREKDIIYKARIINLTPKEESILRDVTLKIDQDIEARKQADNTKPTSPYEGLARYLQFEKLKRELIASELKEQLPKDKYEAYVKADADSASSELEVWHGE